MHPFEALLQGERLPPLRRIQYDLPSPRLKDPAAVLRQELRASGVLRPLRPGQTVAIAAGSREITNLALLVRTLIAALQEKGARPFLVPAMGSHGGATAEGQREILRGYGLSEEVLGVPVLSSMETVCLAHTPQHNYPVYLDRFAAQADWIIPIGRIKPHTDIRGPIQSGVAKMLVIGLGKQRGAAFCHALGTPAMSATITEIAAEAIRREPILFGLGILENGVHETARIAVLPKDRILTEELALLREAQSLLPRIPFSKIDVLIVDQMGKDISGTGMDPNVTGRSTIHGPSPPFVERIVVRSLTEHSQHNATGIGNADIIPQRMFEQIDLNQTYPNCITACDVAAFKLPVIMPNERLAFQLALHTATETDRARGCRLMWIQDTNHLGEFYVSPALLPEAEQNPLLRVLPGTFEVDYAPDGNVAGFVPAVP